MASYCQTGLALLLRKLTAVSCAVMQVLALISNVAVLLLVGPAGSDWPAATMLVQALLWTLLMLLPVSLAGSGWPPAAILARALLCKPSSLS
jgi:hypothetical protein